MPQFASLDEEMDFWATHSPLDFEHHEVKLDDIRREVQSRSKNTAVTVQLPRQDVERLKKVAASNGVDYRTLAAQLLHRQLSQSNDDNIVRPARRNRGRGPVESK